MSPILGIWASSIQPSLNASSYESIATVSVGSGGQSTIEFTSIPQTYKHLQIRGLVRSDRAGSAVEGFNLQLNGVTSNSYFYHRLYGDGTSPAMANGSSLDGGIPMGAIPGANATSGIFGAFVFDILDYSDTNKYKTTRILLGQDQNGSGSIWFSSGLFSANTNGISSIKFYGSSGDPFYQYTSFGLYGIKG